MLLGLPNICLSESVSCLSDSEDRAFAWGREERSVVWFSPNNCDIADHTVTLAHAASRLAALPPQCLRRPRSALRRLRSVPYLPGLSQDFD